MSEWWGTFEVAQGEGAAWRIGPLDLWVWRRPSEWRVAWCSSDDPLRDDTAHEAGAPFEPSAGAEVTRLVQSTADASLHLSPRLADRDVVVRPDATLVVGAGRQVAVYVSTPLWVALSAGRGPGASLCCLPTFRPSDTWFGPDTQTGELCYASRTSARLVLSGLPRRPARATTRMLLHNRASDPLHVERLKVPVRHLSLYSDPEGALWTSGVSVTRHADGALAVALDTRPPPEPGQPLRPLDGPRAVGAPSMLARALDALLR